MKPLLYGVLIFAGTVLEVSLIGAVYGLLAQKAYGVGYARSYASTMWTVGLLYVILGLYLRFSVKP